jgi:hypothetical protein
MRIYRKDVIMVADKTVRKLLRSQDIMPLLGYGRYIPNSVSATRECIIGPKISTIKHEGLQYVFQGSLKHMDKIVH